MRKQFARGCIPRMQTTCSECCGECALTHVSCIHGDGTFRLHFPVGFPREDFFIRFNEFSQQIQTTVLQNTKEKI